MVADSCVNNRAGLRSEDPLMNTGYHFGFLPENHTCCHCVREIEEC